MEYHVQDDADVAHKYVKIFYNTNQFPSLQVFVPHTKPQGVIGLSKYYHMKFDQKIGYGTYDIRIIPCSCVYCTSMLDKPWVCGLPLLQQPRYQPVTEFTYWPVLGSFKNWNIIALLYKATTSEAF